MLRPGGRRLRSSRSPACAASCAPFSASGSTAPSRCSAGCFRVGRPTGTSRPPSRAFPVPSGSRCCCEEAGFRGGRVPAARRVDHRAAHRDGRMNALAAVDATPGLAAYMAELETRPRPGGRAAIAAFSPPRSPRRGARRRRCKWLRPLLCFLSSPEGRATCPSPRAAWRRRRRVATLVHDDLVDGARMRRGMPAAWSLFGSGAALSAGDYLFACSPASLADRLRLRRGRGARRVACLALARGEAMQAQPDAQARDDDRGLPRPLRAQDGEAVRGRLPARLRRRPRPRRLRARARDRLPDRRRHPRLRRADAGDGEDPRHRPA